MVMKYLAVVIVMFYSIDLFGQDYYKTDKNTIILDNGNYPPRNFHRREQVLFIGSVNARNERELY